MNPFQVGDKVRFLNAEGHGIITKIINYNQVEYGLLIYSISNHLKDIWFGFKN